LYNTFKKTTLQHLEPLLPHIHAAWLCNPEITSKFLPIIKEKNTNCKIIYDTIDLHYVRMQREEELTGKPTQWEVMKSKEIDLANASDLVLAVSQEEREKLTHITNKATDTVPNIHKFVGTDTSFQERKGLLFVGGYHHTPNIDAAAWLVEEIMPLVWEQIPNMPLLLLGSNPTDTIKKYAEDSRIQVPGFIEDLSEYFHSSRIFVSPLRYGAGMKGKIGQALEFGLPIVSTQIGIEGMYLEHGKHIFQAENSQEFAKAIIHLYNNEVLWTKLSDNSVMALEPFSVPKVKTNIQNLLNNLL
jgi:O-antigen biosynthesis protein